MTDNGSPVTVHGHGNIVAGRDVNIGSTVFSISQVPAAFQREFQSVEQFTKSSHSSADKLARIRQFAADMTVSGFGAAAGAAVAYLLAFI